MTCGKRWGMCPLNPASGSPYIPGNGPHECGSDNGHRGKHQCAHCGKPG